MIIEPDCRDNDGNNNKHHWVWDNQIQQTVCDKCGMKLAVWGKIYKRERK